MRNQKTANIIYFQILIDRLIKTENSSAHHALELPIEYQQGLNDGFLRQFCQLDVMYPASASYDGFRAPRESIEEKM